MSPRFPTLVKVAGGRWATLSASEQISGRRDRGSASPAPYFRGTVRNLGSVLKGRVEGRLQILGRCGELSARGSGPACARRVHASVSTYPRVVRITKGSGRWSGRGAGLSRARLPPGSPQPAQARPVHVSNARSKRACPRTPSRSLRRLYCHQRGGQPGWKAHPDGRPARKAASPECRRPAPGR